jgi:hypothetical protein
MTQFSHQTRLLTLAGFVFLLAGCEMKARIESHPSESPAVESAPRDFRLNVGPQQYATAGKMKSGQSGYTYFVATTDGRVAVQRTAEVYAQPWRVFDCAITKTENGYDMVISRQQANAEYLHTWEPSNDYIYPQVVVK